MVEAVDGQLDWVVGNVEEKQRGSERSLTSRFRKDFELRAGREEPERAYASRLGT